MKDCPRKGSDLAHEELPPWYYILENILGDTNTKLEDAVSNPYDKSYGRLYFDIGKKTELVTQ